MKAITKILLTSAAVALLAAACGDDEELLPLTPDVQDTASVETDTIPSGWVDLGLPSGLLWAECNLGANAPEEYGDYYAWAETEPKNDYTWLTYRYCDGGENELTKYCDWAFNGHNGFVDSLLSLQPEDDAALQTLGDGAHIPTVPEWRELLTNTHGEWTTKNGVLGLKLSGNGSTLFLPAAGKRWYTELLMGGECCLYWTDSVVVGSPKTVWYFFFYSAPGSHPGPHYNLRYEGIPVRAVRQR